jgi:hypothetical protein
MIKVHWDDGHWAVIEAKDWHPGTPRTKTNETVGDAVKSQSYDVQLSNVPIGPKSRAKFVKVLMTDLPALAAAGALSATAPVAPMALRPSNYGGTSSKRSIPDYPQKCMICGGGILVLFSSVEHEGGTCPGRAAKMSRSLRS